MLKDKIRMIDRDMRRCSDHGESPNPELIVFADDWRRHPSSAQHLVRHLLSTCAVSWINTVGTRAPTLSAGVIRRGLEKLLHWSGSTVTPPVPGSAPRICNPVMYPGFRAEWQRRVNADLLARFLRRRFPNIADAIVVSTIPTVADLPERLNARRWVYYCVDDFSAWPGLDSDVLRTMEQKFVRRVDRIVTAGEYLAGRMRSLGRESQVISHGIDLEHWRQCRQPTTLLGGFERPLVLFWGLIDRRLDIPTLRSLGQSMTRGTIALVGPQQDPDPSLEGLARVKLTGPRSYETLPALASAADTLIMPYADLPVTRAMQPLKFKEYLATGLPVVSTRLPALSGWDDCLDIVDSPEQFASAVRRRCDRKLPNAQSSARERLLRHETWQIKADEFVRVLLGD